MKQLHAFVSRKVRESGQYSVAYNKNTSEAVVFHWDQDTNIGKKLVYTNCFEYARGKTPLLEVPVYDHYKSGFDGCDKFNLLMHNKIWPFRMGGKGRSGFEGSVFNYLFTSVLLNVHHASLLVQNKAIASYSFNECMWDLAVELVNQNHK